MTDRKAITHYLIITFAVTYGGWGILALLSRAGQYEYPNNALGTALYALAGLGPLIAAYAVSREMHEIETFRDFIKTVCKTKRPVFSLLAIPLLLLHFALPLVLGSAATATRWYAGLLWFPMMILFRGLEEIGWHGFLHPRLERKFGFFFSTIMVTFVWGLWHLPLFFIAGTHESHESFLFFAVSLVGISFTLSIITKVTGSVLICVVLHALISTLVDVFLINESYVVVITAAVEVIISCVIAAMVHNKKGFEE